MEQQLWLAHGPFFLLGTENGQSHFRPYFISKVAGGVAAPWDDHYESWRAIHTPGGSSHNS